MIPKSFALFAVLAGASATSSVLAQIPVGRAQPAGSGIESLIDARAPLIRSMCKQAPPLPNFNLAGAAKRPVGPLPYSIEAIPSIVEAGAQWKLIWVQNGHNAGGMVGQPDGSVLIARNDNSDVVRLTPDGHSTVVYEDTNTGGTLAVNKMGQLFVGERSLIPSIWQLAPERKLIANAYQGEPLECQGFGVLDSVVALHTGGVYFGYAGYYHVSPGGQVTKVFDKAVANAVLSPDETKLYMGSGGDLYVADVGSDGLLNNIHVLAKLPGGGNDGAAVDAQGRIYMVGYPGVRVFEPDGKYLGTIPAPRFLLDVAFAGPDKKTLFAMAAWVVDPGNPRSQVITEIYTLPMVSQGYLGRGK